MLGVDEERFLIGCGEGGVDERLDGGSGVRGEFVGLLEAIALFE